MFTHFVVLVTMWLPSNGATDETTYLHLMAGQQVGSETVSTTEENGFYRVRTKQSYSAAGATTEVEIELLLDREGRCVELKQNGIINNFEIHCDLSLDRNSGRLTGDVSYLGERKADVVLPPDILIVDSSMGTARRLAGRFDFTGESIQKIGCFDPVFFGNHEAVLELLDRFSVRHNGDEVGIRHILAKLGSLGMHIYVDEGGEVLQVSIPMQARLIMLEGWKDVIEVKLPEPDLEGEADYETEKVTFPANDVEIVGELTVPRSEERRFPAVVLISGSGPQDLNEDTPIPGPYGLKHGIFRTIAHRLSNSGYIVLRYNDYGVPPSGGSFQTHTLSDRVSVTRGAVRFLQTRREVDKRRIGLIGHSEGGIIAPIVAVEDPEIKAIVLMAGTARPIDQVIMEQSFALAGGVEEFSATLPILMEGWREVATGKDWGRFGGKDNQFLGWFRSHVQHDPYASMARVQCRAAILNGELDLQVLPGNAFNLALALEEGGNTEYTVKIFPGLDHLFMNSESGGRISDYADFRRRLCRDFLRFLEDWLKKNL